MAAEIEPHTSSPVTRVTDKRLAGTSTSTASGICKETKIEKNDKRKTKYVRKSQGRYCEFPFPHYFVFNRIPRVPYSNQNLLTFTDFLNGSFNFANNGHFSISAIAAIPRNTECSLLSNETYFVFHKTKMLMKQIESRNINRQM